MLTNNMQNSKILQAHWIPGDEVVGMYDYQGRSKNSLSFRRGDVLIVVNISNESGWYVARNSEGKEGMIPVTHVKMRQPVTLYAMPWYHGKVSREQVEKLLYPREDGLFLVRDSNNFVGDYTLCVWCANKVENYHIKYENNQLTIDDECFFRNLEELVSHYASDADGLCTKLLKSVPKQGSIFGTVSIDDFRQGGWIINSQDLKLGVLIGRGDFGDVYQGAYTGLNIAAKQLKDRDRGEQSFLLEAAVMTSLRHPNVVKLLGIAEGPITLISEFMGKGNLLEYLQTRGRTAITSRDQINFATDTCAAMYYLSSMGLIHRDLAARNILIHDSGKAKVSDFGLAQFRGFNLTSRKFPVKWTAPEALKNNVILHM